MRFSLHSSRLHLYLMYVWLALGIPTALWWRDAVWWVSFMSLYAIIVSHWSAWQAARVEEKTEGD